MAGRLCLAFAAALLQGVTNATPIPEGPAWTKGAVFNVYGWSDLQYGLPLFFDTDSGSIVMTDYEIASQTDTYLPLAFQVPNFDKHPGFPIQVLVDTAAPMENRAMQSPPFRDAKFFLPAQKSPSRGIGILTDGAEIDGDDIIASKFIIHEFRLAIMRNDGRLMFGGYCAFPTDRPKVYTVDYNVTDTELANTGIPIDLLNHTPDNYEFKAPKDRYTGACRSVGAIEI